MATRPTEAEVLNALRTLLAASQHISPFGGDATVKRVRLAMKYMAAHEEAERILALADGREQQGEG